MRRVCGVVRDLLWCLHQEEDGLWLRPYASLVHYVRYPEGYASVTAVFVRRKGVLHRLIVENNEDLKRQALDLVAQALHIV